MELGGTRADLNENVLDVLGGEIGVVESNSEQLHKGKLLMVQIVMWIVVAISTVSVIMTCMVKQELKRTNYEVEKKDDVEV